MRCVQILDMFLCASRLMIHNLKRFLEILHSEPTGLLCESGLPSCFSRVRYWSKSMGQAKSRSAGLGIKHAAKRKPSLLSNRRRTATGTIGMLISALSALSTN